MKHINQRQSFKAHTTMWLFITLISTLPLIGLAYAREDVVKPRKTPQQPPDSIDISSYVESIEGIAWQGRRYLWVLDDEKKKIDRFDTTLGKPYPDPKHSIDLTKPCEFGLKKFKGLVFDKEGKVLWVVAQEKAEEKAKVKKTPILIKIDPVDGKMEKPIKMEIPVDKGFDSIEGITWDEKGKCLWVAIYAGYSSSFNQIDPETGEINRSIFADCNPRGIATDGEYLWSICYNDKKFPSKIDKRKIPKKDKDYKIDDYEIFHSRTFVKDIPKEVEPNGLAFDDIHLWYADRETKTVIRFTPPDVQEKSAIPPVKGK